MGLCLSLRIEVVYDIYHNKSIYFLRSAEQSVLNNNAHEKDK